MKRPPSATTGQPPVPSFGGVREPRPVPGGWIEHAAHGDHAAVVAHLAAVAAAQGGIHEATPRPGPRPSAQLVAVREPGPRLPFLVEPCGLHQRRAVGARVVDQLLRSEHQAAGDRREHTVEGRLDRVVGERRPLPGARVVDAVGSHAVLVAAGGHDESRSVRDQLAVEASRSLHAGPGVRRRVVREQCLPGEQVQPTGDQRARRGRWDVGGSVGHRSPAPVGRVVASAVARVVLRADAGGVRRTGRADVAADDDQLRSGPGDHRTRAWLQRRVGEAVPRGGQPRRVR